MRTGGGRPLGAPVVHLDGESGDDSNSGQDESTAVKTIEKAVGLAGRGGTIVVDGPTFVNEKIDLNDLVIERGDSMFRTMFIVHDEMTLADVTIDGKGRDGTNFYLVEVRGGGHLVINDGSRLVNNQYTAVRVTQNGSLTMNGGEISNNNATGSLGIAGAVDLDQCEVRLNGGEIKNNQATYAGAIRVNGLGGYCELNGTKIFDNVGGYGGAFFVQGSWALTDAPSGFATLVIKDGEIVGNTATVYGGAIYVPYNGDETNVVISGGTIKDNVCASDPAMSAIYLATTSGKSGSCNFSVSGSPVIEGGVCLMQKAGRVSTVQVEGEFSPASPMRLHSLDLADGGVAVRYGAGTEAEPNDFVSGHEGWALEADGQTLVWRQLKGVSFESADGSVDYGRAYAGLDGLVSAGDVPDSRRDGYELAGWRLAGAADDDLWDFATDKVDAGDTVLVAVWRLARPTVAIDASVTKMHKGSGGMFELEARPDHAIPDVSFRYVWTRDGVVVDEATEARLVTDVPGNYAVVVTAGSGADSSDGAESDSVLCAVEPHESASWSSDGASHWRVCSACGAVFGVAEHRWGSWATTQEPGAQADGKREHACLVCGFMEKETVFAPGGNSSSPVVEDRCGEGFEGPGCGLAQTGDSPALPAALSLLAVAAIAAGVFALRKTRF